MWTCPLCGAREDGDKNACTRCGYTEEQPKADPKPRDVGLERKKEYKRAMEDRKDVLLLKLQGVDLSHTPIEEVQQILAEVLTSFDVPLRINSEYTLSLTNKEKEIITLLEQAMGVIDSRIRESPDSPISFVRLGNVEYGIGEFHKALAYYDGALLTDPNHRDALFNKALALFALHRYGSSVKVLSKLIRRYASDKEAQQFMALAEQMVIDRGGGDA